MAATISLPASATLTGTTLVVPGLALAAGDQVIVLYVDDDGDELPLDTWHDLSTLAQDHAYLTSLRRPGHALELVGGRLGLIQSSANLKLPPALGVGAIQDNTGILDTQHFPYSVYSDFIPIEPNVKLTFSFYNQFCAFYDAAKGYIADVTGYLIQNNDMTPPNVAFMRLTGDAPGATFNGVQYSDITYTIGQLPYVRSVDGYFPDENGNVFSAGGGVPFVNTTVLRFNKSSVHAPISTGTFTTDPAVRTVGAETVAYLTATASDPAADLPAATFQLLSGAYKSGVDLMYTFRVGGNGKIHYVITELP